MKLNSKNLSVFLRLTLLFAVILTLFWELVERILGLSGIPLDLSVGPVGFDIEVLAIWLQANPGTILGILPAILIFRKL